MLNLFNRNIKTEETEKSVVRDATSTFYSSYFDTYELIKKSDENIFYSGIKNNKASYFGAFVNKTLNTTTQNAIIKLGIPRLVLQTEETKKQIQTVETAFNNIIDKYDLTETATFVGDNKTSVNHERKSYKDLFCDDEIVKDSTSTKILSSIYEPILRNEADKFKYYSNILEDNINLNPFTVINYEIDLQKSYKNIVYNLPQPANIDNVYPFIIYLLQGIPSKLFTFNMKLLKFELADNSFRLLTCTHSISKNFLDYFMVFGTKMYLIQVIIENYLYNNNERTPYVLKQFYVLVNTVMIKINESLIKLKISLDTKELHMIGLFNKIEEYNSMISLLFNIFNLPAAVESYFSLNEGTRDLNVFLQIYDDYNLKSHKLLNALFEFYYSFHIKSKDYFLVKSLLMNTLKAYLFYILKSVFNDEIYDQQGEFFIIKNLNNIVLDGKKVPKFLADFKNILLNNAILINYIHRLDEGYFNVCNFKVNEIIAYIDDINFNEDFNDGMITEFMNVKNSIFNKKLEIMFNQNERFIVS
jgi:hypothetical protein